MRVVVDTNVWVSYLFQPDSPVAGVCREIIEEHTMLYSSATLLEVMGVLTRPKIARYITPENTRLFVSKFIETGERVSIDVEIDACRDPKDDKFLELTVCGDADCIVTGDQDLLELNPFRGIPIIPPGEFARLRR